MSPKKKKKKRKLTPEERQARKARRIAEAAELVQENYQGVRVSIQQMPYSKTFTTAQKRTALEDFDAEADSVSMSKKLVSPKEPAVQRVREVISAVNTAYTSHKYTLPYPEKGVRLIRVGPYTENDPEVVAGEKEAGAPGKHMERLHAELTKLRGELHAAAVALAAELPAIAERERERQGKLYDHAAYQFDAVAAFALHWSWVDVGVPNYLAHLDPGLRAQAQAHRYAGRRAGKDLPRCKCEQAAGIHRRVRRAAP
jgi:hypothetical protein